MANGFKTIVGAGIARPRGFAVRRGSRDVGDFAAPYGYGKTSHPALYPFPPRSRASTSAPIATAISTAAGCQAGQIQGQKPVVEQMLQQVHALVRVIAADEERLRKA